MAQDNNSGNQAYANNSDGWQLGGGTVARTLTVTGANMTLTGSGTNVYTFPSATGTLVSRTSTDTLTNKTISTGSNTIEGILTNRQGGTTGAATWQTQGTSNSSLTGTVVIMQAGCVVSSSGGGTTITFPSAFNQIPLIFCTVSSGSNGFWAQHEQETATNFVMTCWSATGTLVAKNVNWLAIGQ